MSKIPDVLYDKMSETIKEQSHLSAYNLEKADSLLFQSNICREKAKKADAQITILLDFAKFIDPESFPVLRQLVANPDGDERGVESTWNEERTESKE